LILQFIRTILVHAHEADGTVMSSVSSGCRKASAMAATKERPRVALVIETSNSYARGLLSGIHAYICEHEPWSTYLPEMGRGSAPPDWLHGWRGDGVIARIENRTIADAVRKLKLPTIDVSAARPITSIPWVETDDEAVARMAVEHLVDRGFKRFGFCGDSQFAWSRLREAAMRRALADLGYEYKAFSLSSSRSKNRSSDESQMADWLRSLPKPIGVLACYDICGRQLLEICRRNEILVPEEIAVLGIDNDELLCTLADPPLSSVILDSKRAGYVAAQLLDQAMSGKSLPPISHLMKPSGVAARQSTDILAIDDAGVCKAARFIREHACDGINVPDVLKHTGLSRRTLDSRFLRFLGRTPHDEIRRIQLQRVEELLIQTDLSLGAIADRTGFEHSEYLSVIFKRKIGISPTEFRQRNRN
jgi:LacI family transcriptional regulator